MDGVLRTEEGQVIRTEWIRVRIRDTYGGVRTRSIVRARPPTMQSYISAPSLPRPRSHNRKDSTSTWGSSAPCFSQKYSPDSLARLIRERATPRSSFSGSVDSQGKTKIICGVHPQPFIDECITQLCVGLVEHVNSESMTTCREALESIVDLITAFPYIRSVFQNVGASVAIDRLDAVNRALDERTAFILDQAFEAIFPSDLNDVSLRMHYSRASHANADKSDLSKNFRGLLRLCQSLHQTRPDAALAARYLRYIIFDKQHMKTSLWRSVRQTPDAASQVIVDLLDKELANIVQYIAFGDVSTAEADALFEASLGLMQIQLERTGKVPTALMETILRRSNFASLFPKSAPLALSIRKRLRHLHPERLTKQSKSIQYGLGSKYRGLDVDVRGYDDIHPALMASPLMISDPDFEYDASPTRHWTSESMHYVDLITSSPMILHVPSAYDLQNYSHSQLNMGVRSLPIRSRTV